MQNNHLVALLCLLVGAEALRVPTPPKPSVRAPSMPAVTAEACTTAFCAAATVFAMVEPAAASSDVAWVGPTKFVLQPLLTLGTLAFLFRVVLSWFPKYDLNEMPFKLVAAPTEPILKPTRALIPPVSGVDISPIVWVSILSFISEILTGPQGLLSIIERKGGL